MSQQTRDKLVRDLTPSEAGSLLVHCHKISDARRRALLFKRGPAEAYFSPDEIKLIKAWIEEEDYLPQDSPIEHPKRPTHWCNYCGHVESCEHDKKPKKKREDPIQDDHDLVLAIQTLLDGVEWTPDTLEEIARLLRDNGYRVRDLDDKD